MNFLLAISMRLSISRADSHVAVAVAMAMGLRGPQLWFKKLFASYLGVAFWLSIDVRDRKPMYTGRSTDG